MAGNPEITLMEIYRLPEGVTREQFEEWYPQHILDVRRTNLLNLVEVQIQIGKDEYPRVVTIRTTQENLAAAQQDPAIVAVLQDAARWGATVFLVTPLAL
ncbi:MAG: hypothetical protein HY482_01430 [Candidatus Wildermuthbacteria bacterium]|nr:hypothetical protein [Candidatus Wildermuthbacteria bacterium]